MNKEQIKRLADKIVSGMANDEEIKLYNGLCNSFRLTDREWDENIYGNKEELESSIRKSIWKGARLKSPVIKMKWFKWVAAAIIILISTISFLFINRPTHQVTVIQSHKERFKNDVAPGKAGAILTLNNGQKIILDNIANGSVAQQGNISIIKKNGEIIYNNNNNASDAVYNTMTTPNGRQFNLILADGSRVWLNAASSITFPTAFTTDKERKVTITGEAYFEVGHNTKMPFIVEKENVSVIVLGTHFNVNSYDNENAISVTLLEGSVKVKNASSNSIIKPGQQAQSKQDGMIRLINNVDLDNVMAWKNGLFNFESTDIGTVMRQLSRWYNVDVVYNKKIDELFYADISRNTKLSDVLKALELTGKVRFEIDGKKIIVMP